MRSEVDLEKVRESSLLVGLICHCDNPKCTEERAWARETLIQLAEEVEKWQDRVGQLIESLTQIKSQVDGALGIHTGETLDRKRADEKK